MYSGLALMWSEITRALSYCYIEIKVFYDTNTKQTSIKYRLSNIKTFLYHVGARTRIISSQNHLQHGTQARQGGMVLWWPQAEISAALHHPWRDPAPQETHAASQALRVMDAPQKPRSTEQSGEAQFLWGRRIIASQISAVAWATE